MCTTSQAPARRCSWADKAAELPCGVGLEREKANSIGTTRHGGFEADVPIPRNASSLRDSLPLCSIRGNKLPELGFHRSSKGVTRHTGPGERRTMNAIRQVSRVGSEAVREGFIPVGLHAIWAQPPVRRLRAAGALDAGAHLKSVRVDCRPRISIAIVKISQMKHVFDPLMRNHQSVEKSQSCLGH